MKEMIEEIVKAIVDNPESVKVNEIDGGRSTIIELSVAKEDVGKVIGRGGKTISAMRTLLASTGGKQRTRFILELIE
ncbi:MAG: KH domain-containing protein [bacterium]